MVLSLGSFFELFFNFFLFTGNIFQFGKVKALFDNQCSYRYGFLSASGEPYQCLKKLSLSSKQIDQLICNSTSGSVNFTASFEKESRERNFELDFGTDTATNTGFHSFRSNGVNGMCFVERIVFDELWSQVSDEETQIEVPIKPLSLAITEPNATRVYFSGGKGASLAQLVQLSNETKSTKFNFTVPNGIIVSTEAYSAQIESIENFYTELNKLEAVVHGGHSKSTFQTIKEACTSFKEWFAQQELAESIKANIHSQLENHFGESYDQIRFAVRSSASLEDSNEMSAAGQMTTYLGVKGPSAIYKAVVNCWASQFDFVPINYKHGYGQTLNDPMAVVIQQMVHCQSAGVVFTCDPITGDERKMVITSNFGLGEVGFALLKIFIIV